MTRINTNVSSLTAQKALSRSNSQLQSALTRLSTGMRINVGKDDPAGLIASEILRSDIISVDRAITNSQRANQMIATADSALGQISALLNDIRGLVSEGANSGALSSEQIAANQLQIDSSLEAIDRIAQVTQFQGRRLLDGSLDFITEGVDSTKLTDLKIDQANFGSQDEIGVAIDIVQAATRAELNYGYKAIIDPIVLEVGGKDGFEAFSFAANTRIEDMAAAINLVSDALGVTAEIQTDATVGELVVSSFGTNNNIVISADTAGEEAGDIRIKYVEGTGPLDVTYTAGSGNDPDTIEVELETLAWVPSEATIDIDGVANNNAFKIQANVAGEEFNQISVVINAVDTATPAAAYDHATGTLTLTIDDGVSAALTTADEIVTAINNDTTVGAIFTASLLPDNDGSGSLDPTDWPGVNPTLSGGVDGGAVISTANDVIDEINKALADLGSGAAEVVTASLAEGNNGYATVSAFEEYVYYGNQESNNRIQFLSPAGTRDVRFVGATEQQDLSIDLSTDARKTGFASLVAQMDVANASFEIVAKSKGPEYDDIALVIQESGVDGTTGDYVLWDPEAKTLTVNIDLGAVGGTPADAQTLHDLINADSYVSQFFEAKPFGVSDLTGDIQAIGAGDNVKTSGGVTSEGTLIVNLAVDGNGLVTTTAQDLIDFFETDWTLADPPNATLAAQIEELAISISNAEGSDGTGLLAPTTADLEFATSGTDFEDQQPTGTTYAVNGEDARLTFTAVESGEEYDGVTIVFTDTVAPGDPLTFEYVAANKVLTIGIESGATLADDVVTELALAANSSIQALFTAAAFAGGGDAVTDSDTGTLADGVVDANAGSEQGAALLGNEDEANTGLTFRSIEYGSGAFVSVNVLQGVFDVSDPDGRVVGRSQGTDLDARVNGVEAVGQGLTATINTAALDLTFSVDDSLADGESLSFLIVGGGAQFQLGPDVVSNQQARLGITSVNTAKLGGLSGRLYEIRSGGAKSLDADVSAGATLVEEVITSITTLRGRLGAFQRTTLETNVRSLSDTLEALTAAESSIRDSDFAVETANLTRAQILVQSGLSVLAIANRNPESVLSLLR